MNNRKSIILAADRNYTEQVVTTIKSICCHNRDIDFYLINRNYPDEWFSYINAKLALFNSQLINIRINNQDILHFNTSFSHLSEAAYYRFFISEFLQSDIGLYLDCDLVVNGSLDPFFTSISAELIANEYAIAAVADPILEHIYKLPNNFNSGVMLINNAIWKRENFTQLALEVASKNHQNSIAADQDILNLIFKDRWLKINRGYNYQMGVDYVFRRDNIEHLLEDLGAQTPLIVHYTSHIKPWLQCYHTRYRHLYWHYYSLSWEQVLNYYNQG